MSSNQNRRTKPSTQTKKSDDSYLGVFRPALLRNEWRVDDNAVVSMLMSVGHLHRLIEIVHTKVIDAECFLEVLIELIFNRAHNTKRIT